MWRQAFGPILVGVGLLIAGPAIAQDGGTVSGNVAVTSDYVFRGISQTGENPAIQGGFDYTNGIFYGGTWASNIDFDELGAGSGIELDLYGGVRPQMGPVTFDLGVIGYFYPGVTDIQGGVNGEGELDYVEGYAKASVSPAERWTLGAGAYYSPEFTGETGDAYYLEANAAYAPTEAISITGALGYQSIDDVSGIFPGEFRDRYTTWNAGATYSIHSFAIDLRYVGTDIEASSPLITHAFSTEGRADDRFVLSIKRTLLGCRAQVSLVNARRDMRRRLADFPGRRPRPNADLFQLGATVAKRTEHRMGDFIFISVGLGSFALLALYVFGCGRA